MAKDKTELIQELMYKPQKIRNIAIAAHIDHGKCVSGDTRIHVSSGSVRTAKEIFDTHSSDSVPLKSDENEIIFDVSTRELFVNSFDRSVGRVVNKRITHLWKMKKTEPLVRVSLKNGLAIKTTPEHKFVVWENDVPKEKRADNLTLSDILLLPRSAPAVPARLQEIKTYIMRKLSEDARFYVFVNKEMTSFIAQSIDSRKHMWKEIQSPWDYRSFTHSVRVGRYRLLTLVALSEKLGVPFDMLYDSIEHINVRGVKSKGEHSSVDMKLPKTNEEFEDMFYLVGLMFGDGNTEGNLDNADEQIQNEAVRIASTVLGLKNTKLKKYGNQCPRVYIGANTFRFFLNRLFDFPLVKKSLNVRIPELVYMAPSSLSRFFISGYFDTDGTIEKGRSAVSICSASKGMLQDLQLLLLRFGIPSQFYDKKSTLYLSGSASLELFAKVIQFKLASKQARLQLLRNKAQKARNVAFISNVSIGKSGLVQVSNLFAETYLCQIAEISRVDSEDYVYDFSVEDTHNFIAEGMVVHNTTLTDSLVAGAGMISEELAGQQLFTDFDKQEQERGITIFAANVSMVHEYGDDHYLINLIDTPGHVDFGGDVTRAMRAVDGAVILVDAVESVMPQTETVIRQALHERVKPVLFINKVDRLVKELQLTPEQIQERFVRIIKQVNTLILKYTEKEFAEKWLINVEAGTVAFGSAYRKWATSIPYMKREKISFKDIIEYTSQGRDDELSKKAPLHRVLLDMVIRNLPNPQDAQKYRLPKIWHGDLESEAGKMMLALDPNGHLAAIVTKVSPDPHAGLVATARLLSGSIKRGQEVRLVGQQKSVRVQQVSVYKGPQRVQIDQIPAGNIVGIVGLTDAFSGETVCDPEHVIQPFESIKHIFEPVVTKSVECKDPKDLPKLIMFLKQISREDPTLAIKINEETGEYLVSGLGELHIDAKIERPLKDKGIAVTTSPPIVIYRETVRARSPEVEGKSANKHNRFYLTVEPLEEGVYQAMVEGKIEENVRKYAKIVTQQMVEFGMRRDEAKKIVDMHSKCLLIDGTKGIQYLNETMELVTEGFQRVMDEGPLAREPCAAIKVTLTDAKLHEDAIHRGPAQVLPAISDAVQEGVFRARPILLEPVQTIRIDVPEELMGGVMSLIQNRRGQIIDTTIDLGVAVILAKLPVAEMFGFEALLKSNTGGKGFYSLTDVTFEKIPEELKMPAILRIRERKGLSKELPAF